MMNISSVPNVKHGDFPADDFKKSKHVTRVIPVLYLRISGSLWSYLPASCRLRGTSGNGSTDSASSASCRYGSSCQPHTCTPSCSALSSWRSLYTTRTSAGRSGTPTLCRHTPDTVPRYPPSCRAGPRVRPSFLQPQDAEVALGNYLPLRPCLAPRHRLQGTDMRCPC